MPPRRRACAGEEPAAGGGCRCCCSYAWPLGVRPRSVAAAAATTAAAAVAVGAGAGPPVTSARRVVKEGTLPSLGPAFAPMLATGRQTLEHGKVRGVDADVAPRHSNGMLRQDKTRRPPPPRRPPGADDGVRAGSTARASIERLHARCDQELVHGKGEGGAHGRGAADRSVTSPLVVGCVLGIPSAGSSNRSAN
eukprot:364437-Chlamydomonas_euryale.AAC.4